MRAGRGAAVGVVAKGVDVEATLGVGVIAGDVVGDGGRGTLRVLLEDDGAGDLCVSSEDSNCRSPVSRWSLHNSSGCDAIAPRPSRDTLASATYSNGKKKQGQMVLSIKVAARPAGPRKPFEQIKRETPSNQLGMSTAWPPPAGTSDDYIKSSMALLLGAVVWGSSGALPALTILAVGFLQLFLYEKKRKTARK